MAARNSIDDAGVVLAEQDELIRAQGREIERLRNDIDNLREELEAAELAAAELREERQTLDGVARELEVRRAEVDQYRGELERISQSGSWRLTRPLRAAKALLLVRSR